MTTAFLATYAVIGWGLFLCAAIGGNAIRDDLRRRIDGLNSECARRNQVIDFLAAENNRLRKAMPRDVFVDLNFERAVRGLPVVGPISHDRDGA